MSQPLQGKHPHANPPNATGGTSTAQGGSQQVAQPQQPQQTQQQQTQQTQQQQPGEPRPVKKPAVDLASIINKTKENISNMENQDDEVERQYLSNQENNTIIIACLAEDINSATMADQTYAENDEKVVEVFDNNEGNNEGNNEENTNTIENTIDSIGMSVEPKTISRCNFVFKNKRLCGGKTNGSGDKCSKHMLLK